MRYGYQANGDPVKVAMFGCLVSGDSLTLIYGSVRPILEPIGFRRMDTLFLHYKIFLIIVLLL
jgi:hypothetical protein